MYPNIEAERAKAGMTEESLAAALGVSASTLENWQSGKAEIPASKISILAQRFNVSADYLLKAAGEKKECENDMKTNNEERANAAEMLQAEYELKHLHVDVSALENSIDKNYPAACPEILGYYDKLNEAARKKLLDYAEILLLGQENRGDANAK